MCHYLSRVRNVEILQMQADFYVDANDKIWFFYAKDILWRPKKQSIFEIQLRDKLTKQVEAKHAKERERLRLQREQRAREKAMAEPVQSQKLLAAYQHSKHMQKKRRNMVYFCARSPPSLAEVKF